MAGPAVRPLPYLRFFRYFRYFRPCEYVDVILIRKSLYFQG